MLGAFAFGYALFQIPSGWAGDRYGPIESLLWLFWSTLTILMTLVPLAGGNSSWRRFAWAFAVRFLTGAGEAASYPNANKIVGNWMDAGQRGIGSSLLLAGAGAGGALAPIVFAGTIQQCYRQYGNGPGCFHESSQGIGRHHWLGRLLADRGENN